MADQKSQADVVIAGAGFAGLALALALRQGLGAEFNVVVADPALGRPAGADARASAIAAGARRLLETVGVWNAVAAKARAAGVTLRASAIESFEIEGDRVQVRCGDGALTASLLIAADGARSRLRELAGIPTFGWSYGQSAIVCTVAHERDHGGRAEEHFLPAGPFAILPLNGRRSSIVWTEEAREADRIVALPDDLFHEELEERFGLHLGDIAVEGPRRVHPLGFTVARAFVADRLALVGDAAHVIHPIAGQGLNMGLKDVAALAEVITDAVRLGRAPG